jgi:hypothetical protein
MTLRVAVVPPVPALLPGYLGRVDPVAELRTACHQAVAWLTDGDVSHPVAVLADPPDEAARLRGVRVPLGLRVARAVLGGMDARPVDVPGPLDRRLLVLANGSACRTEKAPGHLDPRSVAFDDRIETALATGDPTTLAGLDAALGRDLLATGIEPLRRLGAMGPTVREADLRYAADPYGVRYWVATWLWAPTSSVARVPG